VLLLGETGTGKELVADAIHSLSPRRDRLMVRVNCAAIPVTLIESELFGRERGAYTGALSKQVGRFELAHGSTIFLDEIGDLPLDIQAKLLRVLQERQIERLGSPRPDPRGCPHYRGHNRDVDQDVRDGRFREDLFYRLNVFQVRVPPLRDRLEDVRCWSMRSSTSWPARWASASIGCRARAWTRSPVTPGRGMCASSGTRSSAR